MTAWRHGPTAIESGERVEVWRKNNDAWFHISGLTCMFEGDVIIRPDDVIEMGFADTPPVPTEADTIWRVLEEQ